MYTIGYDFGDSRIELDGLSFALRLFTVNNAYAPDPNTLRVDRTGNAVRLQSSGLIWGGGQGRAPGGIDLAIRRGEDGRFIVEGRGWHGQEICKSVLLLVKGIEPVSLAFDAEHTSEVDAYGCTPVFSYPSGKPGVKMPLAFVTSRDGTDWFALSKDRQLRPKRFATHYDPARKELLLDLAHEEDARRRTYEIDLPAWHIGRAPSHMEIVRERCGDLEKNFGLKPYACRDDVPDWLDGIKLVTILHGTHWTGHVFNSYDAMCDILEWIAARIEGRHVLAFLPAWDGRYYYNHPEYRPSEIMGGAPGLRRLVQRGHELGVKFVFMMGANNVSSEAAPRLGLVDAVMMDSWGRERWIDWIDWDYDLAMDRKGMMANPGHPGFRRQMLARASRLVEEFGVDGLFLDITAAWENDPRYSVYEGLADWVEEMHRRHPGLLLFAENHYDLLWGLFPIFHEWRAPIGPEGSLYRYARQTYYLAHPAPGSLSAGVHEMAWNYPEQRMARPELTIPTLAIADNTITKHGEAAEQVIDNAKNWRQELPEIARQA